MDSSVGLGLRHTNATEEPPTTGEMMSLRVMLEKAPDADFPREMIGFAAERRMELEVGVGALTGAAHGERNPAAPIRPRVVSAFLATAFARDSAEAAKTQWRKVADQLRPKLSKLAGFMDEAEADVLADMSFPKDHWQKIHSTNGLERLNGEIKRRTEVLGIFPSDAAIARLVGAMLLEQNDAWRSNVAAA